MSMRFRRKRDWSGIIKSTGLHLLIFIVGFSVFVSNVQPVLATWFLNACAGVLCLLLILGSFHGIKIRGGMIAIPLGLLCLYGLFQALDLPSVLIGRLSPSAMRIWLENPLLTEIEQQRIPLSLSALRTVSGVQLYWVTCVIVVAASTYIKSTRELKYFARYMVYIGLAVAGLALTQQYIGNGKIYWQIKNGHLGRGGPFLNYSNMGEFLILAVSFGIMLIMQQWFEKSGKRRRSSNQFKTPSFIQISDSQDIRLVLLLMIVSLAATVSSTGRMVVLASVLAYIFFLIGVSLFEKRKGGLAQLALLIMILGLLVIFVFTSDFSGRFSRIGVDASFSLRMDQASVLSRILMDHPIFGIGLGALRHVYPYYNDVPLPKGRMVTDSDVWYFQLAAELGLIGLGLCAVVVGQYLFTVYRLLKSEKSLRRIGYSCVFLVTGLGVSFFTDFGLQRPGIFIPLAISFGAIWSLTHQEKRESSRGRKASVRWMNLAGIQLILGAATLFSIMTSLDQFEQWQTSRIWQRSEYVKELRFQDMDNLELNRRRLEKLVALGEQAIERDTREIQPIYNWLESRLQVKSDPGLEYESHIDIHEIAVKCAYAAPATYKGISAQAAMILFDTSLDQTSRLALAEELLTAANKRNPHHRYTLIRLAFLSLLSGKDAEADQYMQAVIKLDDGIRVLDLLVRMKRYARLIRLLPEASLKEIDYAYARLKAEKVDNAILLNISKIYIDRYQEVDRKKTASEQFAFGHYLSRHEENDLALMHISQAIRSSADEKNRLKWRLHRLDIYTRILQQTPEKFKDRYVPEYESELRRFIRLYPKRPVFQNLLSELQSRPD